MRLFSLFQRLDGGERVKSYAASAKRNTRGLRGGETRQFFARSPPSERPGQASPNLLFSPKWFVPRNLLVVDLPDCCFRVRLVVETRGIYQYLVLKSSYCLHLVCVYCSHNLLREMQQGGVFSKLHLDILITVG